MVTEQTIKKICLKYKIDNYSINSDGSIDVDGDVALSSGNLSILPLKFNRVLGNFSIHDNLLTSLYGGPVAVGGNFNCFNNRLITLNGAPRWVGGDFYAYSNKLISLVGSPAEVVGSFYISGNYYLKNFVGSTLKIGGDFSFDDTVSSTFSGEDDVEFYGMVLLNDTYYDDVNVEKLPNIILQNIRHLKLILKYQRYFLIWNEDLTFNIENFNNLIAEIEEGLQ